MSQFGNLKHIVDLETLLGYNLSLIDFSSITIESINYSWGDESELINWLRLKDKKTQYDGSFYTISGSNKISVLKRKKYPLIWLVTPTTGVNYGDIKHFENVSIIICSNTKEEWLNSTRWKKYMPMLQAIADNVIDKLRGSLRIKIDDNVLQYSFRNVPKYCITEKAGSEDEAIALDWWDAVVIEADLIVDDSCKDEAYYTFCKN